MPLLEAHLAFVCAWAGLVAAELALELVLAARDAARLHFVLDIAFEAPLLLAIALTGALLLGRSETIPLWLVVKLLAGLMALLSAAACIVLVVRRRRALARGLDVNRFAPAIRATGLAVPLGVIAAWLGLAHGAAFA